MMKLTLLTLALPLGLDGAVAVDATAAQAASFLSLEAYLGPVEVCVDTYSHPVGQATVGVLTVEGMPAGAEVVSATLYASDWWADFEPAATFAGTFLGSAQPYAAFAANPGSLYAYRWDVTELVTGNGDHVVSGSPFQFNYGMALVVVYRHESLPEQRVSVIDRPFAVGDLGTPIAEVRVPRLRAGPATLTIYTQADEDSSSDEVVSFNQVPVGGPLDGSVDGLASLETYEVHAIEGMNRVTITSGADLFGWHLTVMRSQL